MEKTVGRIHIAAKMCGGSLASTVRGPAIRSLTDAEPEEAEREKRPGPVAITGTAMLHTEEQGRGVGGRRNRHQDRKEGCWGGKKK